MFPADRASLALQTPPTSAFDAVARFMCGHTLISHFQSCVTAQDASCVLGGLHTITGHSWLWSALSSGLGSLHPTQCVCGAAPLEVPPLQRHHSHTVTL